MPKKPPEFIENARPIAHVTKTAAEVAGEALSLSQAYERYTNGHGFRTWGAMRAAGASGQTLHLPVKEVEPQHVHGNPPIGPVELWAFTTQANDVLLRTRLYEKLDGRVARYWLAKIFPTGSALSDDLAIRLRDDVQMAWTNRREPKDQAALSVLNEVIGKSEFKP